MKKQRSLVVAKKLISKANKVSPADVAKGRKCETSSNSISTKTVKTIGIGRRRSVVKRSQSTGLRDVSKTSSSIFTLPSRDRYYEDTLQSMKENDEWELVSKGDTVDTKNSNRKGNSKRSVVKVRRRVAIKDTKPKKNPEDSVESVLYSAAFCADRTLIFIGAHVHMVVEKVIAALIKK